MIVSWELLFTTVATVLPLKSPKEEETIRLPLRTIGKLGGICANTIVVGEIELRTGTGRALPQRGFRELHPGRSTSRTTQHPRRCAKRMITLYVSGLERPPLSFALAEHKIRGGLARATSSDKSFASG